MSLTDIFLIVAASAAGWSSLGLSIVVLHHMDIRHGKVPTAAGWLSVAFAGGWLGLIPGITYQAPHWAIVILATALAVMGWLNARILIRQASIIPRRNRWPTGLSVAVAAGAAATVPSFADSAREHQVMRQADPPKAERRAADVT